MRSIFLNKNNKTKFIISFLIFILVVSKGFGQSKIPTIEIGTQLSKKESKVFINKLNKLYPSDLKKINNSVKTYDLPNTKVINEYLHIVSIRNASNELIIAELNVIISNYQFLKSIDSLVSCIKNESSKISRTYIESANLKDSIKNKIAYEQQKSIWLNEISSCLKKIENKELMAKYSNWFDTINENMKVNINYLQKINLSKKSKKQLSQIGKEFKLKEKLTKEKINDCLTQITQSIKEEEKKMNDIIILKAAITNSNEVSKGEANKANVVSLINIYEDLIKKLDSQNISKEYSKEIKNSINMLRNLGENFTISINGLDLLNEYKESVDSLNKTHYFKFKAILKDGALTFTSQHLGSGQPIVIGSNTKLEHLFSDHFKVDFTSLKQGKTLLNEPIKIVLYNNKNFLKHYYNRKWRENNRPHQLCIGFNSSINRNTGFLTPQEYSAETEQNLEERITNVNGLNVLALGGSVGYSYISHSFSITYRNTNYGFSTLKKQNIDWKTGYILSDTTEAKNKFSFHTFHWGIQYRYSNYYRKVSPYFASGINLVFTTKAENNIVTQEMKYFGTNLNLGLGVNIHPTYCWDIHIAPITNLFLNSIQGTKINTRFASVGIEIGVRFNIPLGLKQYI